MKRQKIIIKVKNSSTNGRLAGENLLRTWFKSFYLLRFCFSSDQWENSFLHDSSYKYNPDKYSGKFTFIPFFPFRRKQKQEWNFRQTDGLVTKYICFLFIVSCVLLQLHVEFARILSRNFCTRYSCSYYSFMAKGWLSHKREPSLKKRHLRES